MPINAAPATGPALRPLAVGITPLETRRDVVLQVATRAEELGYTALFVAEGWGTRRFRCCWPSSPTEPAVSASGPG